MFLSNCSYKKPDESIDINPNVKFLPATVDELADGFNQLFKEFVRQGKHEHITPLSVG